VADHSGGIRDLQSLARALGGEVNSGQILAPGPGHSPKDRSLSVKLDADAPDGFVVNSFAHDDPIECKDYVRAKLSLPAFKPNGGNGRRRRASPADISAMLASAIESVESEPAGRVVATYDYTDKGELLYQVLKYEPKNFSQRRPDGKGGWIPSVKGCRRVLYRLPDLLKYPDACIFVTEGEKDADRVASLDHCATTVACGDWTPDCIAALAGRDVLILQDVDKNEAGRKKALAAATALHGTAKTIRIVVLPGLTGETGSKDVSDWLDANLSRGAKLADVCFEAPPWAPNTAEAATVAGGDQQAAEAADAPPLRLISSSAEFVAGFVPPEYVVVGLLQRQFLYSNTGQTGAGKTAVMLRLAASVALGITFAGHETKKVRVLYAAAENPTDVRMRWIALAQHMGFDINTIEVYFTQDRFKISQMKAKLRAEAEKCGGEFGLVIIDTSPAFFEGDDENSRAQMGAHASLLRSLIDVFPGGPCVVANCHPVKNATADNLLPAGGGTFLNEIDGNLTCAKNDSVTELHFQGKFRGPEFTPLNFLIKTVTHQDIKDSDGRLIPTVICECLTEHAREDIAAAGRKDEDEVLRLIEANPTATCASLAAAMGWKLYSGDPNKMKASRYVNNLKRAKLIKETRTGRWQVTPEGEKALKGEA
jgi:AAA domain